jgi:hypothetical protein
MMYKKVENNPGYVRDMNTKGIISVDNDALDAYRRQREYNKSQQNTVSALSEEINNIKHEMQDIKDMLTLILNK